MVQMDYTLGKLVEKLDQIGELENTLIILTSDNGPECEIPPCPHTVPRLQGVELDIPMAVSVEGAAAWYMKELVKYPPQFKIGFLSNNPPVYDLLPKVQELLKQNMEKSGIGRPTP